MVVGRVTSCSPEQVVELLPARLLRTVLLQQQLFLAPDQIVFVLVLVFVFVFVFVLVLVFVLTWPQISLCLPLLSTAVHVPSSWFFVGGQY